MHWVLNKYLFHMFSVFLPRKKAFRMWSDTFFHPYTILSGSNSTNALYCRKNNMQIPHKKKYSYKLKSRNNLDLKK